MLLPPPGASQLRSARDHDVAAAVVSSGALPRGRDQPAGHPASPDPRSGRSSPVFATPGCLVPCVGRRCHPRASCRSPPVPLGPAPRREHPSGPRPARPASRRDSRHARVPTLRPVPWPRAVPRLAAGWPHLDVVGEPWIRCAAKLAVSDGSGNCLGDHRGHRCRALDVNCGSDGSARHRSARGPPGGSTPAAEHDVEFGPEGSPRGRALEPLEIVAIVMSDLGQRPALIASVGDHAAGWWRVARWRSSRP